MKTLKDAEKVTPQQLRTMTEPEVDSLFSAVWVHRHELTMSMFPVWDDLHYDVGDRRYDRRSWEMSVSEVLEKAQASTGDARRTLDKLNRIKASIAELDRTTVTKLEAEFDRRGGWSRIYLVTDGHAHSSRHCSTCNNGEFPTRFFWMVDFSGKGDEEIIKAIGERACSVCYRDAPVHRGIKVADSILLTSEEVERKKAREEEAARRAEKKAKAALNAITQPDGTPLRDELRADGRQGGSIVKTLRTARTELKQECWYQYAYGDDDGRHERNIQHLARAVAWKENGYPVGTEPTPEEIEAVIKPLRDKAVKEVDKDRAAGR